MAAQIDRQARLAGADDIIENSGDEISLRVQVERLHTAYLQFAAEAKSR
jgi:dephospho-CoA kinase